MSSKKQDQITPENKLHFTAANYFLLGITIFTTIIGFLLLATPPVDGFITMNIAPIVLTFAYLVLVPVSIFYYKPTKKL